MSLRLMDAVIKGGPSDMPQRMLLLVLAKLAGRDGSVRVAVCHLMRLTRGDSLTLSELLQALRTGGWIKRTDSVGGGPPTYQISFHRLGVERTEAAQPPRARLCVRCGDAMQQAATQGAA